MEELVNSQWEEKNHCKKEQTSSGREEGCTGEKEL